VYASLRWVLEVHIVELVVLRFMLDTSFVVSYLRFMLVWSFVLTYLVVGGCFIVQRQEIHPHSGDAKRSDGVIGCHELQHMRMNYPLSIGDADGQSDESGEVCLHCGEESGRCQCTFVPWSFHSSVCISCRVRVAFRVVLEILYVFTCLWFV
jgi:hypothetical protein